MTRPRAAKPKRRPAVDLAAMERRLRRAIDAIPQRVIDLALGKSKRSVEDSNRRLVEIQRSATATLRDQSRQLAAQKKEIKKVDADLKRLARWAPPVPAPEGRRHGRA